MKRQKTRTQVQYFTTLSNTEVDTGIKECRRLERHTKPSWGTEDDGGLSIIERRPVLSGRGLRVTQGKNPQRFCEAQFVQFCLVQEDEVFDRKVRKRENTYWSGGRG